MPRFVVYRHVNVTYRWFIEAENKDEARAKSEELYVEDCDSAEYDRETYDVHIDESNR